MKKTVRYNRSVRTFFKAQGIKFSCSGEGLDETICVDRTSMVCKHRHLPENDAYDKVLHDLRVEIARVTALYFPRVIWELRSDEFMTVAVYEP